MHDNICNIHQQNAIIEMEEAVTMVVAAATSPHQTVKTIIQDIWLRKPIFERCVHDCTINKRHINYAYLEAHLEAM